MTEIPGQAPDLSIPPPPQSRRSRRLRTGPQGFHRMGPSLRALFVFFVIIVVIVLLGSSLIGVDPNEKLDEILPSRIEDTFGREGIDLSVRTLTCETLPERSAVFTVTCDVTVLEIAETVEVIVQGSVAGDNVEVDELFSRERLVTKQQAIDYVQRLVDDLDSRKRIIDCDLGGPLAVIRSGKKFTCLLDNGARATITVAGNGSGSISGLDSPESPR